MNARERDDGRRALPAVRVVPLALLAGVVALGAFLSTRPAAPIEAAPGEPAPRFELPSLRGDTTISSGSLEGDVVVLNFWASWCPPCRREAPRLQAASERYAHQGVVVVGVAVRSDSADAARAFAQEHKLDYVLVHDEDGELARMLEVNDRFLPQTFFIDRQWRFAPLRTGGLTAARGASYLGALGEAELERQLRFMLEA